MSKSSEVFVCGGRYRRVSFETFELSICRLKGRRGSLRTMMVMMMMMVMVVVSVGFGTFGSANWRGSTVAIIITLAIIIFGFPPLPSRLCGAVGKYFLTRMLFITSRRARI